MKREYKAANKQREAGVDESDEEELPGMSKQEKAMQKLIRNREGNDAYESDEEENPYASSVRWYLLSAKDKRRFFFFHSGRRRGRGTTSESGGTSGTGTTSASG